MRLRNTKTGDIIERASLDAAEIIAANGGLWVDAEQAEVETPVVEEQAPGPKKGK